jgi:hypothetical protein
LFEMVLVCFPCCHGKWFVLVICMTSFEGESTSLVEFDVWFDLPLVQGEYDLLH